MGAVSPSDETLVPELCKPVNTVYCHVKFSVEEMDITWDVVETTTKY